MNENAAAMAAELQAARADLARVTAELQSTSTEKDAAAKSSEDAS
jgi:hypothetical protein